MNKAEYKEKFGTVEHGSFCPYCDVYQDLVTCLTERGRGPSEGDYGICWDCFEPFRYGPGLEPVKIDPSEIPPEFAAILKRARARE